MAGPFRIYISYAQDATELAQRFQRRLEKSGFNVWLAVYLSAGSWAEQMQSNLERSDAVLILLSRGSYASDFCRAEQIRALRNRKRVFPIVAQSIALIPFYLEGVATWDFSNRIPFQATFDKLLPELTSGSGATPPPELLQTRIDAPALPDDFIERADLLETLRSTLLAQRQKTAVTALTGMPGIGKTVLAQAVCHDEVVQEAFPSGIHWIAGDTVSNLKPRIRQQNATLLVFDDVLAVRDLDPFLAELPQCKFLITTRDRSIVTAISAEEQELALLSEDQSLQLLARTTALSPNQLAAPANEIVRACGYLAMPVAVIGYMLRGQPPETVQQLLDRLRKDGLVATIGGLSDSIQRSVDGLDPKSRERYIALAVVPLTLIPVTLLCRLWNVEENEARATAAQFLQRSLARHVGNADAIQLHPVLIDYISSQYSDHEGLHLVRSAVEQATLHNADPAQLARETSEALAPHHDRPAVQQFVAAFAPESAAAERVEPSPVPAFQGHNGAVNAVAITPDGKFAISGSGDATLKLWDLQSGRDLRTFTGHEDAVWCIAVTADGKRIVSGSGDKCVFEWDLETSRVLLQFEAHSAAVMALALIPAGAQVVTAGDRTVKVWEVETGRLLRSFEGHSQTVTAVAAAVEGRLAITASMDTRLRVWDLESGSVLNTLQGHSQGVIAVALHFGTRLAVSASADRTLKVWNIVTGREIHTLAGHGDSVTAVAITPDGRHAVSGSADTTLKVWDLETGANLRTLRGHSGGIRSVALTPDGNRALSASADGTMRLWDVHVDWAAEQPALPAGADRIRLAYLACLDHPELFELLDHFDPAQLQQALEDMHAPTAQAALASLEQRFPGASPNPLWQAWIETVHAAKLGEPAQPERIPPP